MIVKTYEVSRKKFDKQNFFLIYGENEGQKDEIIQILKNSFKGQTENYDETQIINNKELFYEKIFNQSLFEKEKIIIINRCSEKIYEVAEEILDRSISDTKILFKANVLEKKSKLRNLFEKNKELVVVPTYKDTSVTLIEISKKFF